MIECSSSLLRYDELTLDPYNRFCVLYRLSIKKFRVLHPRLESTEIQLQGVTTYNHSLLSLVGLSIENTNLKNKPH